VLTDEARVEATVTPRGFQRLLEWLDEGVESHGARYLEIRRRLVGYFDRRDRAGADDLADETLTRIARTLEHEEIATRPPARYCHVVARFVLLEDIRRERRTVVLDDARLVAASRAKSADDREDRAGAVRERSLSCLDRCLASLNADRRELIVEYYREARREGIDRRRSLAERLGITMNALSIRASRIREALAGCVEGCRGPRATDLSRRGPIGLTVQRR
jgi:DNA-directed RNA polymerase specialized sigma24 family protein